MATIYEYVNTITGKRIEDGSLLFLNDQGAIEALGQGNALRFTPSDRIDVRVAQSDEGYGEVGMPGLPGTVNTLPYDMTLPESAGKYVCKRKYLLGIDGIDVSMSVPGKASGFVSRAITLRSCSYIELSVKASNGANVEYSILEGLKETPILPTGQTEVAHEKLFYGLGTRFAPDKSQNIRIYKDGQETSYAYDQIASLDYSDGEYTISYVPSSTAHQYYPQAPEIRVKVVQRCREGQVPTTIQSMVIMRHGGTRIWTM